MSAIPYLAYEVRSKVAFNVLPTLKVPKTVDTTLGELLTILITVAARISSIANWGLETDDYIAQGFIDRNQDLLRLRLEKQILPLKRSAEQFRRMLVF